MNGENPDPEVLSYLETAEVELDVQPREMIAGESTLQLRVKNLDVSSIDVLYTLNGVQMPILRSWDLDASHSASVFVGSDTPQGQYVFNAIRDAGRSSAHGWIRVNVPVLVK